MPENINHIPGTVVAFGDVVQLSKERSKDPETDGFDRYIGLEHMEPSDLRVRRWGDVTDGVTFTNVFRPGQVLFGKRRAYQRKVAVADFRGVCSGDIYVLEPKGDQLLPELLPFICQSEPFYDYVLSMSQGGLSPRVNWNALAEYEFALPPLEEQRRIAEVLQAAEKSASSLYSVCEAADTMHRALRLRLFKLAAASKTGTAGGLFTGWKNTTIGAVADFLDGKRVPLKSADRAKRQGPYPYYGASGVIDQIDDFIFNENLLLISEDGANLVDRTTPIAFEVSGKIWVNNHAHVLRAKRPFSNFLIAEYVESLNVEPYVTGTAQPKINKAACERIPIPLPPPEELIEIEQTLKASVSALQSCHERARDAKHCAQAALCDLFVAEAKEA